MSDVAAHLVDEVFPEVPVRQWVCSLPWQLRYAMGYDRALCADVLDAFIVSLRRSLRLRAKTQLGLRSVEDAPPLKMGRGHLHPARRLLAAVKRALPLLDGWGCLQLWQRARWRVREGRAR